MKSGKVMNKIEPDITKRLTRAGAGRPKGSVNKVTGLLKDAILQAAESAGNKIGCDGMVSYLTHQAEENPNAFMGLLGKVLPLQINGSGKEGEHEVIFKWQKS